MSTGYRDTQFFGILLIHSLILTSANDIVFFCLCVFVSLSICLSAG